MLNVLILNLYNITINSFENRL